MYVIFNAVNSLIPFILLPILTRYLTSEQYGELAVFAIWTSFVTVFCGLNVNASANRKYYEFKEDKVELAKYIANCFYVILIGTFFVIIMSTILVDIISNTLGMRENLVFSGILVASCNVLIQVRLGQWQVRERPIRFGLFLISFSAMNLLISLFLVVKLDMQVDGRMLGIVLSTLVFFLIAFLLLRKEKLLLFQICVSYMRDSVKYGAPLVPHVIGAFLLLSVDRAFISYKLGVESAGIYMVAVQFSLAVSVILDSINKAFSPWLFNILNDNDHEEKVRVVRVTYSLYLLIIIGVVISFFISEILVKKIVGSEFVVASEIVPFLVFGQGLRGMYLLVTNYMFYSKRTGVISLITITTGLLNVILLIFLIEPFGMLGAAYSFIISMVVQWLSTWYLANKHIKMPWFTMFSELKGKRVL